jgi:bifunctional non-homologous end joining protein LigD
VAEELAVRVGERTLVLTNLDKVLYPGTGYTKAEVISYYSQIAPIMLPYLRDRALTRVRFPDGVGAAAAGGGAFYEKNPPNGSPPWIRTVAVHTGDGIVTYVVADDEPTVVWLANLAALELHVPQWRFGSTTPGPDGLVGLPGHGPEAGEPRADRVVVDLDPGEGVTMVETARAALLVAGRLAADGLLPIAQTSGSKGIQVFAAVRPCRTRAAWSYVRQLGIRLRRDHPDLFVATMSKQQRAGRVYVDYNQNLAARNTIAPYSMRGRDRPSVATPVSWEDIGAVRHPDDLRFTPEQVLTRVVERGDLAADLLLADPPDLPAPHQDTT